MSEQAKIDDGGPAFPFTDAHGFIGCGMTLRDWFAGKIAIGLTGSQPFMLRMLDEHKHGQIADAIAFTAYDIADAMLKVRKQ